METALSRFWLEYVSAVFMQSWLVIAVALLAWIALRGRSAALRYAVLGLALVKLLLPPSAVWPVDISIPRHATVAGAATVEAGAPRLVEQRQSAQSRDGFTRRAVAQPNALVASALKMPELDAPPATPVVRRNPLHFALPGSSTLLSIWFAVVLVLFVLQGWRIWAVHRRLLAGVAGTDAALCDAVERAARLLGVRRRVEGLVSRGTEGPVVLGLLRPRIIMPSGMLRTLNRGELDALLLHEMAHVRRHDLAVNLAQTALQILWFFHPGVWLLNALVRREREMACDDLAIAHSSNERKDFVAGIMKALGANAGAVACAPCLLGFLELRAGVFQRLKRIITRRTVGRATVGVGESVLLALAALVVLPLAADARAGRDAGRYAQYLNTRWVGSFSARGDRTYGFSLVIDRVRGSAFSGVLASSDLNELPLGGLGYTEGCFRGDTVEFSRLEQLGDWRDVPVNDSFVGVRTGDRIAGRWDLPGFEARRGSTFELTRDTAFERLPDTIAHVLSRCRDMRRGRVVDGLAMQLDGSRLPASRHQEEWWTRTRPGINGRLDNTLYDMMDSLLGTYIGSMLGPQAHAAVLEFQALNEGAMGRDPLYRLWKRSFAGLDTASLADPAKGAAALRSFSLALQLCGQRSYYCPPEDAGVARVSTYMQEHPELKNTSAWTLARAWVILADNKRAGDRSEAFTLIASLPIDSMGHPDFVAAVFAQTMTSDPTSALLALRCLSDVGESPRLEWALHKLLARKFGWQDERQNVFRFAPMVEAMGDTRWPALLEASSGLRTWLAARAVEDDPRDLARIAQRDFGGPRSRSDRYSLLLSDLLARHSSTRELAVALVDRALREVRDSLEAKPALAVGRSAHDWTPEQRTAVYTLVLACAHYRRAQLCVVGEDELAMEHRRLAAEAYLDTMVWQHHEAIGADSYLLRTADYAAEYAVTLEAAGRKRDALAVLERDAAIVDPSLLDRVMRLRNELGMPADEFQPQLRWDLLPRFESKPGLTRLDSTPVDIGQWKGKWVLLCPAAMWADNGKLELWREPIEWYERSGRAAGVELALLLGWASDQVLDSLRRDAGDLPILRDTSGELQNANIQGGGFSRSLVTPKGQVVYLPNSDDWWFIADALIASLPADTSAGMKQSHTPASQTTVARSSTTGTRTRQSLMQTVMANLGGLREAYNSQLRSTPGIQGQTVVKFAINDKGVVIFSQTMQSTLGSAELDSTVARLVSKWQFGPIDKEGDVTEVVYPFTFSQ